MDFVSRGVNCLRPDVEELRKWMHEETFKVRRTWLECVGVPIHGWTMENFRRIGETWGKFVECDSLTMSLYSFKKARFQIDTTLFPTYRRVGVFLYGWRDLRC